MQAILIHRPRQSAGMRQWCARIAVVAALAPSGLVLSSCGMSSSCTYKDASGISHVVSCPTGGGDDGGDWHRFDDLKG